MEKVLVRYHGVKRNAGKSQGLCFQIGQQCHGSEGVHSQERQGSKTLLSSTAEVDDKSDGFESSLSPGTTGGNPPLRPPVSESENRERTCEWIPVGMWAFTFSSHPHPALWFSVSSHSSLHSLEVTSPWSYKTQIGNWTLVGWSAIQEGNPQLAIIPEVILLLTAKISLPITRQPVQLIFPVLFSFEYFECFHFDPAQITKQNRSCRFHPRPEIHHHGWIEFFPPFSTSSLNSYFCYCGMPEADRNVLLPHLSFHFDFPNRRSLINPTIRTISSAHLIFHSGAGTTPDDFAKETNLFLL